MVVDTSALLAIVLEEPESAMLLARLNATPQPCFRRLTGLSSGS